MAKTSLFAWGSLQHTSSRHGVSTPELRGPSASEQQAAEAEPGSFAQAAAGEVAAAGGAATTPAAEVLADADPCGQEQRQGFVDMLLYASGAVPEPLVAFELKRPGKIPALAGRPPPDAVECWEKRKEGGALSSALQQSCPSMLWGAAVLRTSLQLQPHVYMQVAMATSHLQAACLSRKEWWTTLWRLCVSCGCTSRCQAKVHL